VAKPKRKAKRGAPKPKPAGAPQTDRIRAGYAKAEERNQAVRESLDPLAEGERPGAVTAGAIFSAIVALIFWVTTVLAATGAEINGSEPQPTGLAAFALIMSVMAWGMWNRRYWAVLGFQMLLVLLLLSAAAGLITATTVLQVIGTTVLILILGALFYFMVKAMARIQMPTRDP
jgi:hypothetical protein